MVWSNLVKRGDKGKAIGGKAKGDGNSKVKGKDEQVSIGEPETLGAACRPPCPTAFGKPRFRKAAANKGYLGAVASLSADC